MLQNSIALHLLLKEEVLQQHEGRVNDAHFQNHDTFIYFSFHSDCSFSVVNLLLKYSPLNTLSVSHNAYTHTHSAVLIDLVICLIGVKCVF